METMLKKKWWAACLLVVGGLLAQGCGGDMWTVGKESRTAKNVPHPSFPGKGGGWEEMSFEDRKEQMEQEVYPAMFSAFRLYDEHKYKEEGSLHCMSCHGLDKSETDFSKPSKLYPLDPRNLPTRDDKDPRIANAVRFMEDTIIPKMNKMLGRDLGCFGCHASTTGQDLRKVSMRSLRAMQTSRTVNEPKPTSLP